MATDHGTRIIRNPPASLIFRTASCGQDRPDAAGSSHSPKQPTERHNQKEPCSTQKVNIRTDVHLRRLLLLRPVCVPSKCLPLLFSEMYAIGVFPVLCLCRFN